MYLDTHTPTQAAPDGVVQLKNIIKLNIIQIFKLLLLFLYYIFKLFFHILVESTKYIQYVVSKTLILVTPMLICLDSSTVPFWVPVLIKSKDSQIPF